MAGSITIRQYTADDGGQFAIRIDKSNANGIVGTGGTQMMPPRTTDSPDLPRGLTPRYILCQLESDPKVKRKFKIGGVAQIAQIYTPGTKVSASLYPVGPNDPGGGVNWIITAYRGEKRNLVPAFDASDTGQQDGNTQA
jgi:hypothetical protein